MPLAIGMIVSTMKMILVKRNGRSAQTRMPRNSRHRLPLGRRQASFSESARFPVARAGSSRLRRSISTMLIW